MSNYHVPVLLQPVCAFLRIQPGEKYIDATFGGGGHSTEIIHRGGFVLGIDRDPDAMNNSLDSPHLELVKGNFSELQQLAETAGWIDVAGIVFDLGLSMHQIATASRGFSFQSSGPLDMRMDPQLPYSAADLVNTLAPPQLENIFSDFGDIARPQSLVSKIITARPLSTTDHLAEVIGSRNLTRKVFQALRIAVNDELGCLHSALPQALTLLKPGGRIVVISFHSLEDRLVKQQFAHWQASRLGEIITTKPVIPDLQEISKNPASHSAKLRVFQKKYA